MNCREAEERDVRERYLLDRLDESEREEFEKHFFECDSCFSQLQISLAIQERLRSQPPLRAQARGAFLRRTWAWTPALAALVLLLAVGLWWRSARRQPQPQLAAQSQTQPEPFPQSKLPSPAEPSLDELAKVEPPPYKPVVLRGAEDESDQTFRKAMEHYSKGDYASVIPGLRAAVRSSPQNPRANFYLGACYLLADQTESAIESLRKTISIRDSAYSEEAHFYLAKAYLKNGRIPEAKTELQETVQLGGSRKADAEQILRQLPM
jgi:TolA-binding protein